VYLLRNWLHLLWHAARHGRLVVNLPYVAPRLIACAVLGKAKPVWYDNGIVYAIQLKALAARAAA
jgi:hypothetical protein